MNEQNSTICIGFFIILLKKVNRFKRHYDYLLNVFVKGIGSFLLSEYGSDKLHVAEEVGHTYLE